MRSTALYMVLARDRDGVFRCIWGPCTRQGCKNWKERHPNEKALLVKVKPVW